MLSPSNLKRLADKIQKAVHTQDAYALLALVQRGKHPMTVAHRYEALLSEMYWKRHNLAAVIAVGRAGIYYCLNKAADMQTEKPNRDQLRSVAKGLAYDVGSFAWPGWEEPGIEPTAADLAAGRDCARLNLRLAIELKKSPERLSMAHWLVGAQALAANDPKDATNHFRRAQTVLPKSDPAATKLRPLNAGCLAIAQLCTIPNSHKAQTQFDACMTALKQRSDGDAASFRTQLLSAHRLFVKRT